MWDSFWDFIWYTLVVFAFVAYLIVLWHIVGDLFRRKTQSGWIKALWLVLLILIPYLTALVYLIVNGSGMASREKEAYDEAKKQSDEYIRSVAGGTGPTAAEQIAQAKGLLDSGAITPAEFEAVKAKALA